MIANELSTHLVDAVYAAPDRHSSLEVLVAVYGYAVQIFADFMGYTNIAIGVALLLGFEFPQNFNSPYTRRLAPGLLAPVAHDPVAVAPRLPVHPARRQPQGPPAHVRQPARTMLLGGLWHGAAWTFVIWGGLHGAGLAVERVARDLLGARRPRWGGTVWSRGLGRLLTFHFVCLGWVFFRAPSLHDAGAVLGRLFTAWGGPSPLVTTGVLLAIAAGLAANFVPVRAVTRTFDRFARLPAVAQAACLAVGLLVVDTLGPQGVAPFIYFRF